MEYPHGHHSYSEARTHHHCRDDEEEEERRAGYPPPGINLPSFDSQPPPHPSYIRQDERPPPRLPSQVTHTHHEQPRPPPSQVSDYYDFPPSRPLPDSYDYPSEPPPPRLPSQVTHTHHEQPRPPPPQVSDYYNFPPSRPLPDSYDYPSEAPPPRLPSQVIHTFHEQPQPPPSHISDYNFPPSRPVPDSYEYPSEPPLRPAPAYSPADSTAYVTHVSHEVDQSKDHYSQSPHLPSFVSHHKHQPVSSFSNKPTFKVVTKAAPNYSLTVREGQVILAPFDPTDDTQQWYKDEKYSTRVKDEEGFPCFALANKATGLAIKHSIGATHPVQLIPYNPEVFDESILWTQSKDVGDGFRAVRMVNNIHLNVDAFHGDKKSGGVHDGTPIVLWKWNKGDNQRWKIIPN